MSSGFITESEAEEQRRQRQLEWEKVRKPDDPLDAPQPEPIDCRPLYDRLQEQKAIKQEEFDEARKLKNLVKGLDDEEADFLDAVDKARMEEEKRKRLEEAQELLEFRKAASALRDKVIEDHVKSEVSPVSLAPKKHPKEDTPSIGTKKVSQSQLLAGIVRKRNQSLTEQKVSDVDNNSNAKTSASSNSINSTKGTSDESDTCSKAKILKPNASLTVNEECNEIPSVPYKGGLVCIGVLPGLGSYSDSSDEQDTSSSEDEATEEKEPLYDLCGRRIVYEGEEKDKSKK